jgi:hypothetical protein
MRANAGRALRGLRGEFALDPQDIARMQSLTGDDLADMLAATQGDPRAIKKVLQPGLIARIVEGGQFFMINNLISSPLTQGVIAASNTWQALSRPAMRMAGSAYRGTYATVGTEAQKMYGYMAASIPDAFRSAVEAFNAGESIIAPHVTEITNVDKGLGQTIAQMQWGPCNNVGDVLSNVLTAGLKTMALPSRFVGMHDEFVKQVVYRGKLSAQAFMDGSAQGLAGNDCDQLSAICPDRGQKSHSPVSFELEAMRRQR